jgi:hypothetical protein
MEQSIDGDTIDCVPRHEQHALDHPLLKNHKIQLAPPHWPAASRAGAASPSNSTGARARARRTAWQTWHHAGHCPRGTVPVRRTTADDVLRGRRSLFHFGRKRHRRDRAPRAANAPDVVTGNGHEVRSVRSSIMRVVLHRFTLLVLHDPSLAMVAWRRSRVGGAQ